MRALIIVVIVVFGIIFVGGALNLDGAPIFAHIDRLLGTDFLMQMHYAAFFWLYRGEECVGAGVRRTEQDIEEISVRYFGIDKEKKYRQLDDALKEPGS